MPIIFRPTIFYLEGTFYHAQEMVARSRTTVLVMVMSILRTPYPLVQLIIVENLPGTLNHVQVHDFFRAQMLLSDKSIKGFGNRIAEFTKYLPCSIRFTSEMSYLK